MPPRLAATLYAGLPEGSRTVMRESGIQAGPETALLAVIADLLGALLWKLAGARGEIPKSIYSALGQVREQGGFDTPEEFEAARERILRGE